MLSVEAPEQSAAAMEAFFQLNGWVSSGGWPLGAQQKARRKAERDRAPADVDDPDQDLTRDWKEELLNTAAPGPGA